MEALDTLKAIFSGAWNLIVGLRTTGKYLPGRAVTLQYPDERWTMPERSRGVVVLLSDPETGELVLEPAEVNRDVERVNRDWRAHGGGR